MKLKIKNINKIADAELDLKGLTVIVGENDSGKSTIGRMFFSLIKAVANAKLQMEKSTKERCLAYITSLYKRYLSENDFSSKIPKDILPPTKLEFEERIDAADGEHYVAECMEKIAKLDFSPRWKTLMVNDLEAIHICLQQINSPAAALAIEFRNLMESEFMGSFCSGNSDDSSVSLISDDGKCINVKIKKNDVTSLHLDTDDLSNEFYDDVTYVESPLYVHLMECLRDAVAFREMGRPTLKAMVPAHVKDFVDKIQSTRNLQLDREAASDDFKIDEIIGGKFSYDEDSRTIMLTKGDMRLRPLNVASGIKSFGTLQMLLDSFSISANRPLVWDEPENHLHPQWQVEFAKILVQLVHAGIPVLVSTHSPYFLQAIRFYAAMFGVEKYVNYYSAEKYSNNGLVSFKEVTNDLNQVFASLAQPLNEIMNVDEVRRNSAK